MKKTTPPRLAKIKFESVSKLRYQLRRFLRFSESATKAEGITPLQYLLMLHVRGFPDRDWATVGELAERLQLQHHGVVALLWRCEESRLVMRRKSDIGRRQVEVHPTALGGQALERLT